MQNLYDDQTCSKKTNRLQIFLSKIHINWLIDYQSINIFKIWIFEKKFDKNVISTRDVLFDEKIQFDDILFDRSTNLEIERIINRIQFFQKEINNANKFIKNEYVIEFQNEAVNEKNLNEKMHETFDQNENEVIKIETSKNENDQNNQNAEKNQFSIQQSKYEFSTSSFDENEKLASILHVQLTLNQKFFNFEICYQCELQNYVIINRSASSKITFQRHDAFAAERLFKRFYVSNFFFSFFKIRELN